MQHSQFALEPVRHSVTMTMVTSSPAKILVGISLDPDESKELLSWAITVLARPKDNIIATHVLG